MQKQRLEINRGAGAKTSLGQQVNESRPNGDISTVIFMPVPQKIFVKGRELKSLNGINICTPDIYAAPLYIFQIKIDAVSPKSKPAATVLFMHGLLLRRIYKKRQSCANHHDSTNCLPLPFGAGRNISTAQYKNQVKAKFKLGVHSRAFFMQLNCVINIKHYFFFVLEHIGLPYLSGGRGDGFLRGGTWDLSFSGSTFIESFRGENLKGVRALNLITEALALFVSKAGAAK